MDTINHITPLTPRLQAGVEKKAQRRALALIFTPFCQKIRAKARVKLSYCIPSLKAWG